MAAGRASLEHFRDSAALVNCGADGPFDYSLLIGKLALTDVDGNSQVIESDTNAASGTIATVRPSLYDVAAEGGVVCIKILRTDVDVCLDQLHRVNRASVAEAEDEDKLCSTRSLILDLEEDIATERLQLPSAPELAVRIRGAVSKDNCISQTIARLSADDPALAVKILKIANSPFSHAKHNISTLDNSVARIGMHTVSELIVCFSLKDLFNSNIPSMRLKFAELVGESVRTGACASVIAGRSAPAFADQLLVAGVLSNLGALPILARLSQQLDFAGNRGEADAILTKFTPRLPASERVSSRISRTVNRPPNWDAFCKLSTAWASSRSSNHGHGGTWVCAMLPSKLDVYLCDDFVGHLVTSVSGEWSFVYAAGMLAHESAVLPVSLTMLHRNTTYRGDAVYSLFSNLLPEGELRRRIAQSLGLSANNDFALLARIAGDCPGAYLSACPVRTFRRAAPGGS